MEGLSPGASFRSFERFSNHSAWRAEDEEAEEVKAALEQTFAAQIAAHQVVLVQSTADGRSQWRAVKLRKLAASDREELMSKVRWWRKRRKPCAENPSSLWRQRLAL
jgi:hypothetical protein